MITFDAVAVAEALQRRPVEALRALADHIEAGDLRASVSAFPNGLLPGNQVGLRVKIDIAAKETAR